VFENVPEATVSPIKTHPLHVQGENRVLLERVCERLGLRRRTKHDDLVQKRGGNPESFLAGEWMKRTQDRCFQRRQS
jgi:hypothetical protein